MTPSDPETSLQCSHADVTVLEASSEIRGLENIFFLIQSIKIVGGLNPNIVIEFSLQYSEIRSDLDYFTLNLGKIEKPQNKN